jgi:hypothetical protein
MPTQIVATAKKISPAAKIWVRTPDKRAPNENFACSKCFRIFVREPGAQRKFCMQKLLPHFCV